MVGLIRLLQERVHEDKIKEFCAEADCGPMFMVRIHLHEHLQNHQKCLSMFFKHGVIKEHVFEWLRSIEAKIRESQQDGTREKLLTSIRKNIGSFIEMAPEKTVKLADQWFESDYLSIVGSV